MQKQRLSRERYLLNPCGEASLPYWKTVRLVTPDSIRIVHDDQFDPACWTQYEDEPYFRLRHSLRHVETISLPQGFCLCEATEAEYAAHINTCYPGTSITEAEIASYTRHVVYCADLWLAVRDTSSKQLVASGIAELDAQMGEGILEWIQVSPAYRRRGLGRFVVTELLRRMSGKARFVTVSGQMNNPASPERLYRRCGFEGHDVWHVLREKA